MAALVSIVVPVFNGMPHLPATVTSALQQTYRRVEIVLVDGGSTDESWAWMSSLDDPRVRIERLPQGTTAAENWTEASRLARGDFVKLLCQDDILHSHAIEQQVLDLEQNPTAVMAFAQRDIIDAEGKTVFKSWGTHGLAAGLMDGRTALVRSYERGTNIFGEPVAVLFPREVLLHALPWNDDRPFLLDVELYTRVMSDGDIYVRKNSVGAFRISASSWSTRLAQSQTEQLRWWQEQIAATLPTTALQRISANLAVRSQSKIRRVVYRYLKLRGAFH
jgi:glycosyltransferase involved in cell wall biosynthesis